jgi:membrane-associated phospholipid phosphatase
VTPFARALDALHLVALSFFLAIALAAGSGTAVAVFLALMLATAFLASRVQAGSAPAPLALLHLGWPLVVLPVVFTSLQWLAPSVAQGRVFDPQLAAMDREWFGVDVARWSEGFLTGAIADPFMALYFLYFLMPVVSFAWFLHRGDRAFTYRAAFAISFGVYACYMLYLLVPATGPRHAYVNLSAPLPEGLITGRIHDFIRDLEPQPFDAFPSCHVVLGLLCAAMCWPLGGWRRWSMVLVGAGTALSTVVLRYHYLVDDLAGVIVVGLALAATRFMDARIARKAADRDHDRMGDLLAG